MLELGTVQLQMYVSAEGEVLESRVVRSSGQEPLDHAAQLVAASMKFSPFQLAGENVDVWMEMPISFAAGDPEAIRAAAARQAASGNAVPGRPLAPGVPPFPGQTQLASLSRPPALINMAEVQQALLRNYPPELRSAGTDGAVTMRIYIGADGTVVDTYPVSSTDEQFASAGESIARMMRFRPAEKDGQQVPVWVEMPVNFQSDP